MKIKKFTETFEAVDSGKTFYKIIDKGSEKKWLDNNFKKDKKTMVTANKAEIEQINDTKTAVKLTNVPKECIIDNEGKWYVLEPYLGKSKIKVEKI